MPFAAPQRMLWGAHCRSMQEIAVNLLDLSRWQFAITILFHMTFPAITVGLSMFVCLVYGM